MLSWKGAYLCVHQNVPHKHQQAHIQLSLQGNA